MTIVCIDNSCNCHNPNNVIIYLYILYVYVQAFLRAAVVFLHYWYNRPITTYVEVIWESHDNQMTIFRRIHFTRLLSIVVSELDHSQIPRELLTMQNNALVALVNPFNNLCHS